MLNERQQAGLLVAVGFMAGYTLYSLLQDLHALGEVQRDLMQLESVERANAREFLYAQTMDANAQFRTTVLETRVDAISQDVQRLTDLWEPEHEKPHTLSAGE